MWIDVEYKEKLKLNQEVRVKFTGHEAKISKIIDKDKFEAKKHTAYAIILNRNTQKT